MKHFLIYFLCLTLMFLGSTKVRAQNECPDIEWMRFFNNDKMFSCLICHIDSNENTLVYGSYGGNPLLGNYNFPVASAGMPNTFVGKLDSAGNALWVHTAKPFTYGYQNTIFSPFVDSSGYIYTTIDFKWKTEFAGVTYVGNPQKSNALFIKMNQQGQVLDTLLIRSLSDNVLNVFHVDENGNLYCYADLSDTLIIDSHVFVTNGEMDALIFKLSSQFQLQWAQQIGGNNTDNLEAYVVDNQNNVYIAGMFNSATLTLGATQLINNYYSTSTFNNYIVKINNNGQFEWATQMSAQNYATQCGVLRLEIDTSDNLYLLGHLRGEVSLGNNLIQSQPANNFNSFLIKYNQVTQKFSSLILNGGNNTIYDLLYVPDKNMMVFSGAFSFGTVDFYIDSVTTDNRDFYVLGVGLSSGTEQMQPQWLVNSHGSGDEFGFVLAKDFEDNIYLSGTYSDDLGAGAFGNYTFPAIPGNNNNVSNGYQAKLSFLSREVTDSNGVLSAVQDSAMYQWLDCGNGMQPVAGATGQSFQPTQSGNYAVRVSNSFCSVVSDCISTTGISETERLRQTEVYPNPVWEMLHLSHLPLGTQVSVFDVLGRAVYSATATNAKLDINTRFWSPGLYMLRLSKDGAAHLEKVVKE